jgi:hypothetical protein
VGDLERSAVWWVVGVELKREMEVEKNGFFEIIGRMVLTW